MPNLPAREFVKVTKGGVSHTVPVADLAYYKRAQFLEEGEEPNLSNMTPAEKRMAQIDAGEMPDNQVSSVNLANVDVPATAEEVAVAVNMGSVDSGVAGPAASAEAQEDAEEVQAEETVAPKKATVKKAGK